MQEYYRTPVQCSVRYGTTARMPQPVGTRATSIIITGSAITSITPRASLIRFAPCAPKYMVDRSWPSGCVANHHLRRTQCPPPSPLSCNNTGTSEYGTTPPARPPNWACAAVWPWPPDYASLTQGATPPSVGLRARLRFYGSTPSTAQSPVAPRGHVAYRPASVPQRYRICQQVPCRYRRPAAARSIMLPTSERTRYQSPLGCTGIAVPTYT